MKKLALLLCLVFTLSFSSLAVSAGAAPTGDTPAVEIAKKKKKKKKSKKCKPGYKKSGSKCKKGPYKKGQTCAMADQDKYKKYGYVCLDLSTPGFPLTYLDVYKK